VVDPSRGHARKKEIWPFFAAQISTRWIIICAAWLSKRSTSLDMQTPTRSLSLLRKHLEIWTGKNESQLVDDLGTKLKK
jgi:hypothetical protein